MGGGEGGGMKGQNRGGGGRRGEGGGGRDRKRGEREKGERGQGKKGKGGEGDRREGKERGEREELLVPAQRSGSLRLRRCCQMCNGYRRHWVTGQGARGGIQTRGRRQGLRLAVGGARPSCCTVVF